MTVIEESLLTPLENILPFLQKKITEQSHYFGIRTLKNPLDFWIYQELIFDARPDVIVEIGNYHGGSALALAHLLDQMSHGRVLAVDVDHSHVPEIVRTHPRITLVTGAALDVYPYVRSLIGKSDSVMVIEDSSHSYDNTLGVLRSYSSLVRQGGWFIVEDGICNHGIPVPFNPGPYEAIETFLIENSDFEADRSREAYVITWNPKGFLRRVR